MPRRNSDPIMRVVQQLANAPRKVAYETRTGHRAPIMNPLGRNRRTPSIFVPRTPMGQSALRRQQEMGRYGGRKITRS